MIVVRIVVLLSAHTWRRTSQQVWPAAVPASNASRSTVSPPECRRSRVLAGLAQAQTKVYRSHLQIAVMPERDRPGAALQFRGYCGEPGSIAAEAIQLLAYLRHGR